LLRVTRAIAVVAAFNALSIGPAVAVGFGWDVAGQIGIAQHSQLPADRAGPAPGGFGWDGPPPLSAAGNAI
jgi:hypothetical protein